MDPKRDRSMKHNPELETFEELVEDEVEDPRSLQEHPDGSAPPLDRLTQDVERKD